MFFRKSRRKSKPPAPPPMDPTLERILRRCNNDLEMVVRYILDAAADPELCKRCPIYLMDRSCEGLTDCTPLVAAYIRAREVGNDV